MSFTRNKNSKNDYLIEKKQIQKQYEYNMNNIYGTQPYPYFPGDGLIGSKIPSSQLSVNFCDVETKLFGIGSNDFENNRPEIIPQLNELKSLDISDKIKFVLPKPIEINVKERPMYLN